MKIKFITYFFLFSVSLSSCFPSYNASNKEYRRIKPDFQKQKAFVMNKELEREFTILKQSDIYEIVDDSTDVAKIKLYELVPDQSFQCGNLMAGSMLTLGLLPSVYRTKDTFSYDVSENNTVKNYQFKLEVNQSLWLFNIFRLGKTYNKQAGKALLGSYMASNN
jgi:hypothetical protein